MFKPKNTFTEVPAIVDQTEDAFFGERGALHLIDLQTSEHITGYDDCPVNAYGYGIYWVNLTTGDYLVHYFVDGSEQFRVVKSGRKLGLVEKSEDPSELRVKCHLHKESRFLDYKRLKVTYSWAD